MPVFGIWTQLLYIDLATIIAAPTSLDIHDSIIVGVALVQPERVDGVITRDNAITNSGLVKTI